MPNRERSVVELEKVRDYCLNPEHPRGRHKARVFASALGLTAADAERLQRLLLDAALTDQAEPGAADEFGQRYLLDFAAIGPDGPVLTRSVWIVRHEEGMPRLVTCYVL